MPIILEMPALSPSMEKGNLVSWIKNEGDEISVGDVIAEIDTDKATMEVESNYKGVLEKIIIPAGTHDVLVKTPIAVIRQKNDTDQQVQEAIESIKQPAVSKGDVKPETQQSLQVIKEHSDIKASPLAKRIAAEYGIDISKIKGTGPGSRIIKGDVLSAKDSEIQIIESPLTTCAPYVDEDITQMRKVIAEKLTKSKQDTPHFYMNISANVSELLDLRYKINNASNIKILIDAFIAKAAALAMNTFPEINSSWANGKIRKYNTVDVSIAVAIDGGLITPIVRNCDKKSLKEISKEIRSLADSAKAGSLKPDQFIGGGITISNLGMYGIDSFSSIINPPQGSILSIGPSKKTPVYNERDEIVPASIMNIGYAVDHRIIDGAVAAKFLCNLVKYLENPISLLV